MWAAVAAGYGLVMVAAAATQPIRRRALAMTAATAYVCLALGAGTLSNSLWVSLALPGALLLSGYWLSGFFFRDPQPWLEQWLLRTDGLVGASRWMGRIPRLGQELLELIYALDYAVVGGGAIYAATFGIEAVDQYWSLVLAAELASYAPLPWLRSRPPRVIEMSGLEGGPAAAATCPAGPSVSSGNSIGPGGPSIMRRLNTAILDNASVQANTLPSGHVSGAVAAALSVWTLNPVLGAALAVVAGLIAIAAIAGRYHYVVDCVSGAIVALAFSSLM